MRFNSYTSSGRVNGTHVTSRVTSDKDNSDENLNDGRGLWLIPSYFNHACVSNCQEVYIGDVMFIYAKCYIEKGEELSIQYFPDDIYYEKRDEIAQNGKFMNFSYWKTRIFSSI